MKHEKRKRRKEEKLENEMKDYLATIRDLVDQDVIK